MIVRPKFEIYRQSGTMQFIRDLLDVLPDPLAVTLDVAAKRTALNAVYDQLNLEWQPESGSLITPHIAALDAERDDALNGLKATLDAWGRYHYDASWRDAATILVNNITSHGDRIYKMPYQDETAVINAVLNDLEGIYAGEVNTLGLGSWVANLRNLNNMFQQAYLDRNEEIATIQPGIIADLMAEMLAAYRTLSDLFDARHTVAVVDADPLVAQYQTVENEWNSLIAQYNQAALRKTGGNNDLPPPEPETPPAL